MCQAILNKRLLDDFNYPLTLTTIKLGVATLFAITGWLLRLRPVPKGWIKEFRHLFPVVFLNILGLVLADYSLFSGTVFVNQVTRAAQSSFTIMLTSMPATIWGMFPIMFVFGGIYEAISMSSLMDICFLAGMTSNAAFTLRGIFSKRVLWQHATPANNFGIITVLSFLSMVPVVFHVEGK